jgi:hypothetical protein
MINLKKNDAIADAVRGIMEKELVGNQKKLDKNHNGKLDSQDFKMLRGQKKATEDVEQIDELKKSTLASYAKKAGDESSYYSFAAGSRSEKDPQRLVSDKLAMKRLTGVNKAVDRLAKEDVEQQDEAMSHQAKTTMKHIPNPSPALKKAAKDIKPGVAGYRDRVAMLKAGGVKEEAELEENAFDYKSPRQPEPNGGSGVKKGTRYGGSKQKEKPEQEEPKEKNEEYVDEKFGGTQNMLNQTTHKSNDPMRRLKITTDHPRFANKPLNSTSQNILKNRLKSAQGTHSKPNLPEEIDPSDRTEDTPAGRVKTKQKDDVGPGSDGRSTKVKYHPGPMTLKKMRENYEEPILNEMINEVLSKDASAYDYIHDFVHSDNPKFAGKSKAERKKQALAAYYAKKNEEAVQEGLKSVAKKAFKALTGGSDEDQRKDLQRKMGVPQTGQKPVKEEEQVDEVVHVYRQDADRDRGPLHSKHSAPYREVNQKSRDQLAKEVKSARKSGAFKVTTHASVTGHSGKTYTQKTAGGLQGSKLHVMGLKNMKANESVVSESKGPTSQMDEPFITDDENKPLNNAKSLAAKTMKRMKNEMLGKTGTSE